MNWHYRVKAPNEKVRDPIQGEFFSTEAIKNPADALVREAVQNAMDGQAGAESCARFAGDAHLA